MGQVRSITFYSMKDINPEDEPVWFLVAKSELVNWQRRGHQSLQLNSPVNCNAGQWLNLICSNEVQPNENKNAPISLLVIPLTTFDAWANYWLQFHQQHRKEESPHNFSPRNPWTSAAKVSELHHYFPPTSKNPCIRKIANTSLIWKIFYQTWN